MSKQQQVDPIYKSLFLTKPTNVPDPKKPQPANIEPPRFKKELPDWKLNQELQAKISLECSARCLSHKIKDQSDLQLLETQQRQQNIQPIDSITSQQSIQSSQNQLAFERMFGQHQLGYGEQLCLNRCVSKFMNVKEIVDHKLKENLEFPPILFNQNLP
eukprot:403356146